MAKTLGNLQTEIRIYLDEANQTDFLDSEVTLSANRAYQDLAGEVMTVYENFYETVTPFKYAIVLNQQEYAIDTSLIKVTRVEINYNPGVSGSQPSRAVPVRENEVRGNLANTNSTGSSFFSAAYYLHGPIGTQQIGFIPVPTQAGDTGNTKSISVWGEQMPADLVNTTDTINIPYADRFAYLIALRAAVQLLRKGQQEESAASRYMIEYNAGIQKMKEFLTARQADDTWMVTDADLNELDFSTTNIV